MTIYDLKPAFQKLLRPTVKLLINLGLTPNTVTIITCFLSLVMATILYLNPRNSIILLTIPIFMFCRMALNAIDGMMAKEHGMITPLGTLLNEFTDVLADSALYLAFCSQVLISEKLIVAITLLAVLSEFIGVTATTIGASRRYEGPMGKSDRAFIFGLVALLLGLGLQHQQLYNCLFVLVLLLLALTIKNRIASALAEVTQLDYLKSKE